MQKLREKLTNILRKLNTPLAYAITSAIAGLLLILLPQTALAILLAIIGVIFLAFGVLGIIAESSEEYIGIFRTIALIKYTLIVIAGACMVFRGQYLLIPFCRILGAGILLYTIVHLRALYFLRGKEATFYIDTILSVILTIAGVLLILTPHSHAIFAGAALLLLSAKLFFDIFGKGKRGKSNASEGVYYVDDFVDKSNE